jgi:type IV pilus assembly protein PilC
MPEKQAKGFAGAEQGQSFDIKKQGAAGSGDKQIRLEITESKGGKILLRRHEDAVSLTGNPIIDFGRKINAYFIDHAKVKVREKATFYRLLSVMMNAGLPLIRSLNTLGVQQEKSPKLSKILFQMAKGIESGKSLSDVMSQYNDVFDDAQIGVVRAGEASGQLNKALRSLAEEIEKSASIQGKIKGALIYPAVIMTLLVGVIFLMMVMVVPQMSELFTKTGKDLPLPTKILIAISDFCVNYWPVIVISIPILVVAFNAFKKTRSGKYLWDSFKLKIPVFGPVVQKGVISKFARSFSNMMGSGVPIIKSIEIVAFAVGNEVYKRRLLLTAEDMKRGIPMAENMAESTLFPKMLVNMIEVGEQTAQLETVVLKVAEFYDEEIDNMVAGLTKLMEPMILVIMGVSVGGIVAAIFLPIMALTGSAGQ